MLRNTLKTATQEVLVAIEKSGINPILKSGSREKSSDTAGTLRSLRAYSIAASTFSPAARQIVRIFKLDRLEDPEVWLNFLQGETPIRMTVNRSVLTLQSELPKILNLLEQETIFPGIVSGAMDSTPQEGLGLVRISLVETNGTFSTVQRLIDALSACQELYDAIQRMHGDVSVPLAVGAIDSGSDKSLDLFGAANLMKEFRELVVSIWGLIVFHKEHKLGRRLELIATALPILERVNALEQEGKLGREEAQIVRNEIIDGSKKFISSGVMTDDLNAHASHDPRALLSPEPKLLTGPQKTNKTNQGNSEVADTVPPPSNDSRRNGTTETQSLSEEDLERLADKLSKRRGNGPSRGNEPDE